MIPIKSQTFQPDSWWPPSRAPGDLQTRVTAGEYLAVLFLRDGGLAVVSPIMNWHAKRFGFSFWKLEEFSEKPQGAK